MRDRSRYALAEWSVEKRPSGWFFTKTYGQGAMKGPYSSAISVALMIARELVREISRRHGPPEIPGDEANKENSNGENRQPARTHSAA